MAGCADDPTFQQRYNHYFPAKSEYVQSTYRQVYDAWLFGAPPPKTGLEPGTTHRWQLYHAFHGDALVAHQFFHNPDRTAAGEYGEAWTYDCVLLLIKLGDTKFGKLLMHEDPDTREQIGAALDSQVDFQRDPFPRVRALYPSHWRPPHR